VDLATAKSLDKRAAALMESHNHAELTEKNICVGEGEALQLTEQLQQLDDLLLKLMRSAKYHIETSSSGV
jgi:lysine/ornithine N-monooxygenase